MASRRRASLKSFRSNKALQQYVLTDVVITEKSLGSGSYGRVLEVMYGELECAAKKIHDSLLPDDNPNVEILVEKYEQECQIMASLRHPNITQFLGICYLPDSQLPLLVMEQLDMSLNDLLDYVPNLPLTLKISFLKDVCSGLDYLHKRSPPIIHRDLTARNVLLTSSLSAKITDMGNSRIVPMKPGQLARTLSQLPGTLVYMPPEALNETHSYGPSLDIFSFGHLALYTLIQVFPGNLLAHTYDDPDNHGYLRGRTEIERRATYVERLETCIAIYNQSLVDLVKKCLADIPQKRPLSKDLLKQVQSIKQEVERSYGGSSLKYIDVGRVQIAKDMKRNEENVEYKMQKQVKDKIREIDELQQEMSKLNEQLKHREDELQDQREELQLKEKEIKENRRKIQHHIEQLQLKEQHLQPQRKELQQREDKIQHMTKELQKKEEKIFQQNGQIKSLMMKLQSKDEKLKNSNQKLKLQPFHKQRSDEGKSVALDCTIGHLQQKSIMTEDELRKEIVWLEEELQRCKTLLHEFVHKDQAIKYPQQGNWKRDSNMLFGMDGFIHCVKIQEIIYVGGGLADLVNPNNYIVMAFNTRSCNWYQLTTHQVWQFAMVDINSHLVLIGGEDEKGNPSTLLSMWDTSSRRWMYPYMNMPTARSSPSAVVYKQWLIVAGGHSNKCILSTVEVFDVTRNCWCIVPPTPTPWHSMKSTILGDTWFLMGGSTNDDSSGTDKVFYVSLPDLVSQVKSSTSSSPQIQLWKNISGLKHCHCTPLCVGEVLLALGGKSDKTKTISSAIRCYSFETKEWIEVGQLPHSIFNCACFISEQQMLIAGGTTSSSSKSFYVFHSILV